MITNVKGLDQLAYWLIVLQEKEGIPELSYIGIH
jgi:hypothetical protein